MNKLDAQRQKEIQQAEELLFTGPQALGFAKGLFQGQFVADWVMPYPRIPAEEQSVLDDILRELRQFLDADLDAAEIDRQADIPRSVIDWLGPRRRARYDCTEGIWRTRFFANGQLQSAGRNRPPLRIDFGFR